MTETNRPSNPEKLLVGAHDSSIPGLDTDSDYEQPLTEHEYEWIEKSGVSKEITQAAIESVDHRKKIATLLGWKGYHHTPGYFIRGVDPRTGKRTDTGIQFKPDEPIELGEGKNRKKHKYFCGGGQKGSEIQPIFLSVPGDPDYWPKLLNQVEAVSESNPVRIIITEGAKKAGACLTDGLPCIALQGVDLGTEKGESAGEYHLKEWLELFCKPGVQVFLAFDRDQKTKKDVKRALDWLTAHLRKAGCEVRSLVWDDQYKGIDDYYAVKGKGSIAALIDKAEPMDLKPKLNKQTPPSKPQSKAKQGKGDDKSGEYEGFYSDPEKGLIWYQKKGESVTEKKVSAHIEVLGSAEHEEDGQGIRVQFLDRNGKTRSHFVTYGGLVGDGQEACKDLAKKGLWIKVKHRPLLIQFLIDQTGDPSDCLRIVNRCGWHDDSFVVPDRTYGSQLIRFQDIEPPKRAKQAITGTLDDWKQSLGRYCVGNPRLMFFVLVAIAPPLSKLLKAENGGYHLFGESSKGKTTALKIAASIYGDPENINKSWHSTNVGLELMASEHNDQCLFLDEIGQADPRVIDSSSYFLANGQGKQRGSKNITLKQSERYSVLILSTGEHPSTEYIAKSGKQAKSGQEVRLVDVPVDSRSGMGVFDNLHEFKAPGELAEYLNKACSNHHGVVFEHWMENLVNDARNSDKLLEWQGWEKTAKIQIAGHWWDADCAPMIKRILSRLAVVYVAGIQAVKYGVLPFSEKDVLESCQSVFKSFMEHRGSGASRELIQDLEAVESFLAKYRGSNKIVKMSEMGSDLHSRPSEVIGFLDDVKEESEKNLLLIKPSVFKSHVQPNNLKALHEEMVKKGWIDQPSTSGNRVRYDRQKAVPGEGKIRVYILNISKIES